MIKSKREHKGKSLIEFPEKYVVVDIETSGLAPESCEIIEISALKYISGQKGEMFSTLIKPDRRISGFITNLTGISNDMVKNAPGISEAILKFHQFIGDDILMGYNVNFDVNFLYDNLLRCHGIPLTNDFVDILRIARKVLPELPDHRQTTVASYFGISTDGAHRAETDCEICNGCYIRLQEKIVKTGISLDEFGKKK